MSVELELAFSSMRRQQSGVAPSAAGKRRQKDATGTSPRTVSSLNSVEEAPDAFYRVVREYQCYPSVPQEVSVTWNRAKSPGGNDLSTEESNTLRSKIKTTGARRSSKIPSIPSSLSHKSPRGSLIPTQDQSDAGLSPDFL